MTTEEASALAREAINHAGYRFCGSDVLKVIKIHFMKKSLN